MLNTSNMQNSGYNMYGGRECRAPYAMTPPSSPFSGVNLRTAGINGVPGNFGTGGAPAGVTFGNGGVYSGSGAPYSISPQTSPTTDTVLLSTKKTAESSPNWKKILGWTAAGATVLVAGITVAKLIKEGRCSEIKNLEKVIEPFSAGSVKEAESFVQKNFGIRSLKGCSEKDLDLVNSIIEFLRVESNAHNGKLYMPKDIVFKEMAGDVGASVSSSKLPMMGQTLNINTKFFKNLDGYINSQIEGGLLFEFKNGVFSTKGKRVLYSPDDMKYIKEKVERFKSGKMTSVSDKLELFHNLRRVSDDYARVYKHPGSAVELLFENKNNSTFFQSYPDFIANFKQVKESDQGSLLLDMFDDSSRLTMPFIRDNKFNTFHHEFGHIQDRAERVCTTLDCNNVYSKYPKELKQWVDNKDNIKTALKVSEYSTSGPGEFIAETYAGLMSGRQFSQDVLELYKKLHGPSIPGIV